MTEQPKTEWTELEAVTATWQHLRGCRGFDYGLLQYWRDRKDELEASEKEAEKPIDWNEWRKALEYRLRGLGRNVNTANERIEALGKFVNAVSVKRTRKSADLRLDIDRVVQRLEDVDRNHYNNWKHANNKINRLEGALETMLNWHRPDLRRHRHGDSGEMYFPDRPDTEGDERKDPSTITTWDQCAIEACSNMEDPKQTIRNLVQFARIHNACGYSKDVDPYA